MTYKSLNTFVDDLFAFVIKMPVMHRLACFRDDIVFFIFLYQRHIYKTDYTRVNEYGQAPVVEAAETQALQDGVDQPAEPPKALEDAGGSGGGEGVVKKRRGARDKVPK